MTPIGPDPSQANGVQGVFKGERIGWMGDHRHDEIDK
jgi:hypothetical protein